MGMRLLPVYMYLHHLYTWCLWRSEEGVGYPRTRIMESCEVLEYFDQTWLLYKNMCSDLLSHLSSHMKPDIFNDLLHLSLYATKV